MKLVSTAELKRAKTWWVKKQRYTVKNDIIRTKLLTIDNNDSAAMINKLHSAVIERLIN